LFQLEITKISVSLL